MNTKLVTLVALSLFGLGTVPAQAQDTRTVSYADLDLSNPQGIAQLDARIAYAVKAVCDSGDSTLRSQLAERRCRSEAYRGVDGQRRIAIAGKGLLMAINTARRPRFGR